MLHDLLLISSLDFISICVLWPVAVLLGWVPGPQVINIIALSALLARHLTINTFTFLEVDDVLFQLVLSSRASRLALVCFFVKVTGGVTAGCALVSVSWFGSFCGILTFVVLANALPAACCTI